MGKAPSIPEPCAQCHALLSPEAPALLCTHSGQLSLPQHMDVNSGNFPGRERSQMLQAALPPCHPQSSPAGWWQCHCARPCPGLLLGAPFGVLGTPQPVPGSHCTAPRWVTACPTFPILQPTLTGGCPLISSQCSGQPLPHMHTSCKGHRALPDSPSQEPLLGLRGTARVPREGSRAGSSLAGAGEAATSLLSQGSEGTSSLTPSHPQPHALIPPGWPTLLETKQPQTGSAQHSHPSSPSELGSSRCRGGHGAVAGLGGGSAVPGTRQGPHSPQRRQSHPRDSLGAPGSGSTPTGGHPRVQRGRDTYRKCREKLRSFPICQGAAGTKGRCFRSSCS